MAEDVSAVAAAVFTAAKKSGHAWVDGRLAWCAWHEDAIVLVTGGGEQRIPLAETAEVTLESSDGAAAAHFTASVEPLQPGTPAWSSAAALLAERRLNSAAAGVLVEQWRTSSTVLRLVPRLEPQS